MNTTSPRPIAWQSKTTAQIFVPSWEEDFKELVKGLSMNKPQHSESFDFKINFASPKTGQPAFSPSFKDWGVSYSKKFSSEAEARYKMEFHFLLDRMIFSDIQNSERIKKRLNSLREMAIEDDPSNLFPINLESLNSIVSFFLHARVNAYPDLTLTPDGNLFAGWENRATGKYLQIVFLPDEMARLLLIRQGADQRNRKERINAKIAVSSIVDFLRSNGATPE